MLRKTYSILAVALTVSACGGTAASEAAGGHQATKQELAEELANTTLQDAVNRGDHFSPLCDADGYPLPGNINPKAAPAAPTAAEFCSAIGKGQPTKPAPTTAPTPAPTPGPAPTTPAPPACDKDALNQQLSGAPLESALADHARFRCLCDDKGYPLVGNINSKGTTASAFCKALKEKGLL